MQTAEGVSYAVSQSCAPRMAAIMEKDASLCNGGDGAAVGAMGGREKDCDRSDCIMLM